MALPILFRRNRRRNVPVRREQSPFVTLQHDMEIGFRGVHEILRRHEERLP